MDKCLSWEKSDLKYSPWSSLWKSCCQVQQEHKTHFLKLMRIIHGQDLKECPWGLLPHCLQQHDQKGMKVLVDFKRSFFFWGREIQTNSMETKWWHLTSSHPCSSGNGDNVWFWFLFFNIFLATFQSMMGRQKHTEPLWPVWIILAEQICKKISLITDKLREPDYIPSQEDILLVRRPTKIFISTTLKLNMFLSKSLIGGQRSKRKC